VPAPTPPAAPPLKEPEEVKLITELPEVAVSGRQWLRKLPDDSFVLVHKTFRRVKDAQAFIRGKEYLVNARIAPVYQDGKDEARFAVVTGHFRSKERASNTISRLGLPSEVTIVPTATAVSQSQLKKPKP
jgi:septal ring-binding cell division protein DamX